MPRTLQEEIAEARQVQAAGNIGRARTCARRAAGMAMQTAIGIGPGATDYAPTFVDGLRRLAADVQFPEAVRQAAARLVDRSDKERRSASHNPVQDAEIIMEFFVTIQRSTHKPEPKELFHTD
jgi:transcription initiation factor TFIIIB Brf1 subunit/transcription initiation factor TFIIB